MSQSYKPAFTGVVWDPRVDFGASNRYLIERSGLVNSYNNLSCDSVSQSNISWSSIPPSGLSSYTNRKIYVGIPLKFRMTGLNPTGGPLVELGVNDALRGPLPLQTQLASTLEVAINGMPASTNPYQYLEPMLRCQMRDQLRKHDYTSSTTYSDNLQDYAVWAINDPSIGNVNSANVNPLAAFFNSDTNPRGGFLYSVVSNTDVAAEIDVILIEPIFVSPLNIGHLDEESLFGINEFKININLNQSALANNVCTMWSHSSLGNPFTSITCQIIGDGTVNYGAANAAYPVNLALIMSKPTLFLNFITPQLSVLTPKVNTYAYNEPDYQITTGGTVFKFAQAQVTTTSQQLTIIPQRIFIYVRRKLSTKTYLHAESYARIDGIQVQYDNNTYLSQCSSFDLWALSRDNGSNIDWPSWYMKGCGSVLVIDPIRNFGSIDTEAAGVMCNKQFQVKITYTNINPVDVSVDYEAVIVLVKNGTFTITEGPSAIKQLGVITQQDVLDSKQLPNFSYKEVHNMYGGDLYSNLKNFSKSAYSFAKRAAPHVKKAIELGIKYGPQVANAVKTVAEFAPEALALVGLGEGEGMYAGGNIYAGDGRGRKTAMQQKMAKVRAAKTLRQRYAY